MLVPVIRKVAGKNDIHLLNTDDILYITKEKGQIVFHTAEETLYQIDTLEDFALLWNDIGFERTDRGCVVNLQNIKEIDFQLGVIRFQDANKSKYATISQPNVQRMKEKANDLDVGRNP